MDACENCMAVSEFHGRLSCGYEFSKNYGYAIEKIHDCDVYGIDWIDESEDLPFADDEQDDSVNHPGHYESGKFECINVMLETQGVEAVKNFCICNAFKYLYRHKRKNGIEDIKKADWYLKKYIELETRDNEDW